MIVMDNPNLKNLKPFGKKKRDKLVVRAIDSIICPLNLENISFTHGPSTHSQTS